MRSIAILHESPVHRLQPKHLVRHRAVDVPALLRHVLKGDEGFASEESAETASVDRDSGRTTRLRSLWLDFGSGEDILPPRAVRQDRHQPRSVRLLADDGEKGAIGHHRPSHTLCNLRNPSRGDGEALDATVGLLFLIFGWPLVICPLAF